MSGQAFLLIFWLSVVFIKLDAANVRLTNGIKTISSYMGIIQVFHNNEWGTVCDDRWNRNNDRVVCRQLGYANGTSAFHLPSVGEESGRIWLDDVVCTGRESTIDECVHSGWGNEDCNHSEDVGVVCYTGSPNIDFRLRDTSNARILRLEARCFGIWGAVCAGIRLDDAHVICRMAGYTKALWVYRQLPNNTLPIRFSIRMTCNGRENSTEQCSDVGLKEDQSCNSNKDIHIICQPARVFSTTSKLRLVGGSSPVQGRVEIQQYGVWGTVCNYGWDISDANVVCRMLNFTGAISANNRRFGSGTGPIWLTGVSCNGREEDIMNCTHSGLGQTTSCSHSNDAAVVCNLYSGNNVTVRLVDGSNPNQGRVEVVYNGVWGTVCDDNWGLADAHVVCRMLNYSRALWAGTANVSGSGPIFLDDVDCRGYEKSLEQCRHRDVGVHNCGHDEDAAVRCTKDTNDAANVSLANSIKTNSSYMGILQVYHNNEWGTVCDDGWNTKNIRVVCRQLGYANGTSHMSLGEGSGRIWLDDVLCTGLESSIEECVHSGWGIENCGHSEDVGVFCYKGSPNMDFRLRNTSKARVLRLEARCFGIWGAVCADIGLDDAHVICRMSGYIKALWVYRQLPNNTLPIRFSISMTCNGRENSTEQCSDVGLNKEQSCSSNQDIHIICQPARAFSTTSKLRLVGGSTPGEGRVEIQQYGVWGTVCNSGWDISDANVVCRMLNFTGAISANNRRFGGGTGPIWLTDVSCNGREEDIMNCTHSGLVQTTSCSHSNDAGVLCYSHSGNVAVRLVDGRTPNQGRVEVRYNEVWGTICDDNWGLADAHVVCRMLNYSRASWTGTSVVIGNGPILLDDVECRGNETSLEQCRHRGVGVHNCGHEEDVAVRCTKDTYGNAGVRLVDGRTSNQGRVEVRYNGVWGTICDDNWGLADAHVVCRMLNYKKASWAGTASVSGSGPIFLDNVECRGNEKSLKQCRNPGVGVHNCDHDEDAAVRCTKETDDAANVSLANSIKTNSSYMGILQVYHNNEWGTVCDDNWNEKNTRVVCRQLGYTNGSSHMSLGEGSGRIWLDDVSCIGWESSIDECVHSGWGIEDCGHSEDVGVVCYKGSPNIGFRLHDTPKAHVFRLEARCFGIWGAVCAGIRLNDAHVICRMSGYTKALWVYRQLSNNTLPIRFSIRMACNGRENSTEQCSDVGLKEEQSCSSNQDIHIICQPARGFSTTSKLRLVGGSSPVQGRVEIQQYGVWGTVCNSGWDISDANVVCRMLNFTGAVNANRGFGSGTGPIWLTGVSCNGREEDIMNCTHSGLGQTTSCSHGNDAGVVCNSHSGNRVAVRLVNGSTPNEGRVEVRYYGVWGTVCDDSWGLEDAHVVCRMLNYKKALWAGTASVSGSGPIFLDDVQCRGIETSLEQCRNPGVGVNNCGHSEDAAVRCTNEKLNVAVRLVNGSTPSQGRVEFRYNGVWGTVCDDGWDLEDARVVCRMLNYSDASWAGTASVSGSGPIFLDDVQCRGNEKSLEQCRNRGLGLHNCDHDEDAAVKCTYELPGDVRLVKSDQEYIGQIEVKYDGTWMPVCEDTWDILDAHVVCRMLGYKAALAAIKRFSVGKAGPWIGGVECSGEEASISECHHQGWLYNECQGHYQAGVMCKVNDDLPRVQVRLEDGSSPNSGRVAVRYGNVWGTVCNRGLDINDAKVICRMLGYPGASEVHPKSTFRPGNGTIWLSNLECYGSESSIADCRHPGWGQTTCTHKDDVTIKCATAEPPHFKINGIDDIRETMVVILFNVTQPIEIQRKSVYQVAVEKRKNEQRLASYGQPPSFVFNEINVTMAAQMGYDHYITAEIPGHISSLTIGDGQYYHGYYNAPLEPGLMYRVQVRIVTTLMDGKRMYGKSAFVAFTTKQGEEVKTKYYKENGNDAGECAGRNKTAVIALSLVIVVHLVIVFIIVAWYCYKKRSAARNTCEVLLEMTDGEFHSDTV